MFKHLKHLRIQISRYLEACSAEIDHKSVMGELATRADISGSYLLSIVLANLIALLGLLVNSVAVVIGAMLISPLMGPIFSAALAFTMGDLRLGRKALVNITASITLTIFLAAVLTYVSPLKEATHEIMVRTRPNIYDLFIAFFAGLAGTVAVCTRKNYLITTTGVAVATAVIPPLSVVGYGIGTWQWMIALGGFLLFFTNLVAIVLSSDLVFYLLRFTPSLVVTDLSVKRRLIVMGFVLALLCIPLVYTLASDLHQVKNKRAIDRILKRYLNQEDRSRVTAFHQKKDSKGIHVVATINTVSYFGEKTRQNVEQELRKALDAPVALDLEQVIVKSGNVAPEPLSATSLLPQAVPTTDSLKQLRGKVFDQINPACEDMATFLAPFPLKGCGVYFPTENDRMELDVRVAHVRDMSEQEKRWLQVVLQKRFGDIVSLRVHEEPLVIDVSFGEGDGLTEECKKDLSVLPKVRDVEKGVRFVILQPRAGAKAQGARQRLDSLKRYLEKDLRLPPKDIPVKIDDERDFQVAVRTK